MTAEQRRRTVRTDFWIAATLIVSGLVVSGLSLAQIAANEHDVAQATQPITMPPAESKPGGARPTTPAPEPARPDADARKAGAEPVLPPAPAEKTAPPINEKSK